ncbi:MAG: hypothetical protein ACI32O_09680, partial [Enterococcus sp.]
DKDQMYVVKNNPDPQAYGEGRITTVAKEGEETKRFIRMKGKLIPVGMQSIEGHGVRMYIKDPAAKKFLPVNYNGMEWYFEAPTSHSIPKEVETKIVEQLDQFETQKNPIFLSAPDSRNGLIWDGTNRSYIKIKEHYIPLILLDKELNRYHLVKKDYHESMTVLRFDEKKGQFRFETELERKQVMKANAPSQAGVLFQRGEDTSRKGTKASKGGSPSTSQGVASQMTKNGVLPPANQLPPNPPGHADEWTKLRKAIPFRKEFENPRIEDDSVPLGDFSKFLPEKSPIYHNDNKWLTDGFLEDILEILPSNPKLDFRVYVGLKSKGVPEYIKLFREKLKKNFTKAQENCKTVKKKCDKLLKKAVLAETPEGQYLIDMFKLNDVSNKEEILKEIITRLRSIAKKGEKFLQKTLKLNFKNIWIVSTELVRQPGTQEYRSLYRERLGANAVVTRIDPECRIIIFADAYHLDPAIKEGIELRTPERETILHEVTHHAANTDDVVRYYHVPTGFGKSGEDTINNFIVNYPNWITSKPFKRFVNHLADSLKKPTISVKTVADALSTNPMLRANFQMTDAEMVMIILRDFADGRAFKERPVIGSPIVKRSINEEELGMESMFTYLVLPYILGDGIFEKNIQLNKTLEQTTTRTTDAVEITKVTSNISFLNLVTSSIERSNSITRSNADQQMSTELSNATVKKNFLDLVDTGTERSTKMKSAMIFNQPINRNRKEFFSQH